MKPRRRRFERWARLAPTLGLAAVIAVACSSGTGGGVATAEPNESSAPSSTAATASTASTGGSTTSPATTTTAVAPTTTIVSTTTTVAPTIDECLDDIPLDVRLGQLLLPVITQEQLDEATQLAAAGLIAGVVLIGAPDEQITDGISALQGASLIGPSIVAVDEEGGRVQRVAALAGTMPSARALASESAPADAREMHRAHAVALGELGFTMNLAPVLDLDTGEYIRDRSFSADPSVVTEYGLAVADGILDAGLVPVVKHFPGHGRGSDSHTSLPTVPELGALWLSDLLPFEAAIAHGDVPIMIGHLVVPGLSNGLPASISPEVVTGLLREEMAFDGLVMTDALNMDAISFELDAATATKSSLIAGVDLAMVGRLDDVPATIAQLSAAVEDGSLSVRSVNDSFIRVLDTKNLAPCDVLADVEPAIRCQGIGSGGCTNIAG